MTRQLRSELKMGRAFGSPEQEAYVGLLVTADALKARVSGLLKDRGLSEPQYNLLRILRGAGEPMPCLEAASRMVARLPDITRLVDRLEKAGWVTRRRCAEDRRVVHLTLTTKGRRLVDALDAPLLALHDELLGHMTRADLKQLGVLLDKAREAVRRAEA